MAAPTPLGDTAAVLLGAPGILPDISGSRVVWTEPIRHSRVIVAFNIETGETRRIAQETNLLDFPSIDGTTVVWQDGNADTAVNIVVGDVFGTEETVIGAGSVPDVSGSHVVFQRFVGTERLVVVYDLDTGREIVLGEGFFTANRPRIDGNRVVWDGIPRGTRTRDAVILLYDIATQTTEIISPPEGTHLGPDISGDWVVWGAEFPLAGDDGPIQVDIVLFNVVTGEFRNITNDEATPQRPVIDGNIVVWQDTRNHRGEDDDRVDLFMYDIRIESETQLTGPGSVPQPFVRPAVSGRRVVWQESLANTKRPNFSILMLDLPQ